MADTLKFGPEWLRALSGGGGNTSSSTAAASVTSPPPTPSAPAGFPGKFKLATYRYGREEMLALFLPKPTVPEELRTFPMIVSEQCLEPVAFIDMTEEEQALLSQSVNSFRVQQYTPRITGPSSRARGSERGRGRGGRGALYTGKSNEFDNDGPRLTAFMRPRLSRPESWDDGEKRFDRPDRTGDRAPTLTPGGGSLGPLRSGLVTDDRTSSQIPSRRDFNRSLSNDSWREIKAPTSDAEKDRDWRRTGPGPVASMAAGARPGGRWRERSFDDRPGDSFSSTQRQYPAYERTLSSEGGGEDDLPEWAVDEPNEGELPAGGTFDASGQFMPLKDAPGNASHVHDDGDEDGEHAGAEESENVATAPSVAGANTKDVPATKVEKIALAASTSTSTSERSQLIKQQSLATPLVTSRDRSSPKPLPPSSVSTESTPQSDLLSVPAPSLPNEVLASDSAVMSCGSSSLKPKESCLPTTVNSSKTNGSNFGSISTETGIVPPAVSSTAVVATMSVAASAVVAIDVTNQLSVRPRSEAPSFSTPSACNDLSDDTLRLSKDTQEADFEHFAKAAEALVQTLSAEDEDHVPHTGTTFQPVGHQHKPTADILAAHTTLGDLKPDSSCDQWFYKDPQGAIQGPFRRIEMADWFNAGYFNMALLVRRSCDDVFQPLGEVIKRFQRVPFEPGPHPPPFKDFVLDEQQRMMHYAAIQQQQQAVVALQQQAATAAVIQQQAVAAAAQRQNMLMQVMTHLQSHENFKHLSPQQQQQVANSLLGKQYQPQQQVKMMASGGSAVLDGRPVSLTEPSGESLWGTSNTATAISPSPLVNAHAGSMWKPSINSAKAPAPSAVMGIQSVWELEQQQEQKLRETEEKRREIERKLKMQKDDEEKRRREADEERRRRAEAAAAAAQAAADAERRQQLMRQQQQQAEDQERHAVAAELQQQQQRRQQQQQQAMVEAMSLMEKERQAEAQRRQQEQRQAEMQRRAAAAAAMVQQQTQSQAKLPSTAQWAKPKQPGAVPTMVGAVVSGQLTLAQIQEQQEEREKQQQRQLDVMRQQQQQQEAMVEAARQQQQQNKSWVLSAAPAGISSTKSLREIQEEERLRQQQLIDSNRQQQNTAAGRLASAVGSSNVAARPAGSVLSLDGGARPAKAPVSSAPASATTAWDKPGTLSGKIPTSGMDASFPSLSVASVGAASTAKVAKSTPSGSSAAQRPKQMAAGGSSRTKEEDNVSKLFSWSTVVAQSAADELTQWCINSLRSLNDSLDAPFLANFLNTVDSPEEVQEYVQSYCGNNGAVHIFIKQYLQRRRRSFAHEDEDSLWEMKPTQQQSTRNSGNSKQPQQQQRRPGTAAARPADMESDDPRNGTNGATDTGDKKSKAKKKKMLKVDSGALLGFSVQPSSERFNVGKIEKASD